MKFSLQAWKLGTIIPLPKKANSEDVTDLCPISLLPVPGKILERLVCTRLNNYLERQAHLTQAQHGYRKGRSTLTSITKFLNDVYSNANEKLPTHAVFLDLRKAFDTVSHSHLIDKLSSLDLNIPTLNWFSSYLSNRYQCIKLGGIASDYAEVTYGVPQGSVLGPVLFSIYINSLSEEVAEVGLQMYADDTILYSSNLNTLQYNLSKAAIWCDQNILTLNTSKTNRMTFTSKGTSHLYQDLQLTINDVQLNKVKQVKYLGLTLDSALAFQDHISVITKQIGNQIYQLSKIRRFLNINALPCPVHI